MFASVQYFVLVFGWMIPTNFAISGFKHHLGFFERDCPEHLGPMTTSPTSSGPCYHRYRHHYLLTIMDYVFLGEEIFVNICLRPYRKQRPYRPLNVVENRYFNPVKERKMCLWKPVSV